MGDHIKGGFVVIGSLIAELFGMYSVFVVIVVLAMTFDVITGIIKGQITGQTASRVGTHGLWRKLATLVALFFGIFLDYVAAYIATNSGMNVLDSIPFGMLVTFYTLYNEAISVCENLYAIDNNILPSWIVNTLKVARDKISNREE